MSRQSTYLPQRHRADRCVDHEIFRLRDEVELSEGKDVTFYGALDIAHMKR